MASRVASDFRPSGAARRNLEDTSGAKRVFDSAHGASKRSIIDVSTSLAQRLRLARKGAAQEDDGAARDEAKEALFKRYLTRTSGSLTPSAKPVTRGLTRDPSLDQSLDSLPSASSSHSSSSSSSPLRSLAHPSPRASSPFITHSTLTPHGVTLPVCGSSTRTQRLSVDLRPADWEEFSSLRRLMRNLFQTDYSDAFYRDVEETSKYSRLAFVGGKCVGGVACRMQQNDSDRFRPLEILVVAMGVVQEFRNQGIGTKLLSHVTATAYRNEKVGRLRLAVHKDNATAIKLYEKTGFQRLCSSHDVWTMVYELHEARFTSS